MNKTILLFLIILIVNKSFSQVKKWTLEECVNYAIKNNISIKNTELDARTANVEKSVAIGNFLPTINANGTHSWNIGLNQNVTTGILENQTQQNTSLGLNSGITLYNGLQNLNRFRRANLSIVASQYQISKMKDDVSLNVANAFLQILFNKENLKVQNEQLTNNQKQLVRSTALVDAGSIPRGDLLDIKATIASNNQNVVLAENALFISKLSLAQLLQLQDFQIFDVDETPSIENKDSGIM
ncbi:MAG: TolC family protein, partial [Flavobacterium sp.]|nr:TolC family protein [Flavobacterium sp.]